MGAGASTQWDVDEVASVLAASPVAELQPLAETARQRGVDSSALATMDAALLRELAGDAAPLVARYYFPALDPARKPVLIVVNEKGRVLWKMIGGFVEAKRAIDETAERVLPHGYMSEYPSFKNKETMTQMPLGGGSTLASIATLSLVPSMGAGASTAIDADARRTEDQWLRELGRAVLDVQAAFDGRPDGEALTLEQLSLIHI